MKVAFIGRQGLFTDPGGDTIQAKCTARCLQQLYGVTVDILQDPAVLFSDYAQYDIVHFWGIVDVNEYLPVLRFLKARQRFVALSPIHVDYSQFERYGRSGPSRYVARLLGRDAMEYAKHVAKWALGRHVTMDSDYLLRGHRRAVQQALKKADVVLPNSISELLRLGIDYRCRFDACVVPNGIDTVVFDPATVGENLRFSDSIVCVGRIEGRKSQLNLIRAASQTGIPTFIIGKPAVNQPGYVEACRKAAGNNITFIDYMPQAELASVFKSAKVHALPSWFETTGLVSLEAGHMGCNIVISDRGDTRSYFRDLAEYCEPDDVDSIRDALLRAHRKERSTALQERIAARFTWELAAQATMSAYHGEHF